jgi:hypothetical protein
MQAMSSSRKRFLKTAVILITIAAAFYYLVFYDWMDYLDGQVRCYSPNHEFYVVRKISVFTYIASGFEAELGDIGTVKLYNKAGNLLYVARGVSVYGEGGPHWHAKAYPSDKNELSYFGDPGFSFELPAHPSGTKNEPMFGCF